MTTAALLIYVVFLALAFGLRTAVQIRNTGSSGFHGLNGRPGSVEWLAGVGLIVAIALGLAAPVLDLFGVAGPVDALDRAVVRWAGAVIATVGVVGTLVAQWGMGDSWRIGVDPGERTELVTSGPFAVVRNPIFSGMLVAGLGLALMVPSIPALAGFALLAASLELHVRHVEEPYLLSVHGDAYREYARSVGRFVPVVGRLG